MHIKLTPADIAEKQGREKKKIIIQSHLGQNIKAEIGFGGSVYLTMLFEDKETPTLKITGIMADYFEISTEKLSGGEIVVEIEKISYGAIVLEHIDSLQAIINQLNAVETALENDCPIALGDL